MHLFGKAAMKSLEQRLQFLERQVTRTRQVNRLLILSVVVVACVAGAQNRTPHGSGLPTQQQTQQLGGDRTAAEHPSGANTRRTIEAEQFVLRDPQGRARASLDITDGGPTLSMFDERGKKRLELSQTNRTVGLRLLGPNESSVVLLQLPHGTKPGRLEIKSSQGSSLTKADGLFINDAAQHARLQLALLNGNFPLLGISESGQHGPPSIEMTVGKGSRSLKLHDVDGRPLFSLTSGNRGATFLSMTHPDHERSLQVSTGPRDADSPTIAYFAPARADGTGGSLPRLQLGLRRDGQPYVRSTNGDGRTTFSAP
jgi:hypothetical protein